VVDGTERSPTRQVVSEAVGDEAASSYSAAGIASGTGVPLIS
jgi:hypothetical protein